MESSINPCVTWNQFYIYLSPGRAHLCHGSIQQAQHLEHNPAEQERKGHSADHTLHGMVSCCGPGALLIRNHQQVGRYVTHTVIHMSMMMACSIFSDLRPLFLLLRSFLFRSFHPQLQEITPPSGPLILSVCRVASPSTPHFRSCLARSPR